MNSSDEQWSLIIKPKRKLLDIDLRDVIRYRDLILLFVRRDFVTQYKQTVLGPIWYILNPLLSTVVYSFVFGTLAKIGTDGVPYLLFYYSGSMLWTFFSGCFTDASNIFVNNAGLFGKVYFPRLTVPISNSISNGTRILVQFVMLVIFYIYYLASGSTVVFSWRIFIFPFIFLWLALLGTGIGMVVSALTTKYRDLRNLTAFALQLVMYATPVVYPLSQVPLKFEWLKYANPVCTPVELFRVCFFGAGSVSSSMLFSSLGITAAFVFGGLVLFNQNERNFIDVV
jgi:lipopolysaccharide transport system permease protein